MPENDIYNSKKRYEHFVECLDLLLLPPEKREVISGRKTVYYCKNKENLEHFRKLCNKFDALDISYVRRCRLLNTLKLICYAAKKDLEKCDRDDIDKIVAFMHTRYNSPKTKSDFIIDIKYIWRVLFPEKDEKGRIDETITPYPVRHLRNGVEKSREKARKDKLTWEEFGSIVNYFSDNIRIQAYLALAVESLGRPQEILYTKIKDLEIYDNYAKLHISEHGKEGIGILQCIDSFPYMLRWYKQHPLKNNRESFLFVNKLNQQLKPNVINKLLRKACNYLEINKPITCYSLKRNGVTFARLRGESDVEIQHKARWSSTKQLKTYDLSNQEDSFKLALSKRGLLKETENIISKTKTCMFCGYNKIGFSEEICPRCYHVIDRSKVKELNKIEKPLNDFIGKEQIQDLFKLVYKLQKDMEFIKNGKV